MFRCHSISAKVLTSLLVVAELYLCGNSATAGEQSPWLEVHSTHFTVITDAGDKKGREVALRFEQMRSVFATLLTKDRLNQPRPLTILAFKNDKLYYQVAPLRQGQPIDVPGFLIPGKDQDFIVLNLFEEEPWRAVVHDFAHLLLNSNYPPAQGWFDEGLAEYFSSIRVDNKQVEIGGDPELRASVTQDLLQNQRETHPPKSLTELLGAQVWLSIPDLFTMKHEGLINAEGTHHTLFYAQSWMVMHYLLNHQKLAETGAYFDLVLNQHVPVEEAIQKAYGMTAAQFEQAVKDYFHSQTALATALDNARQKSSLPNATSPAQVYHFPAPLGPDDIAINSKPLSETNERAIYAEVQVRIPERREYGLKELKALATAPPPSAAPPTKKSAETDSDEAADEKGNPSAAGNAIAHRVLAWDHIEHAEFDEALAELSDAATLNQRDMWIRYYLSVLKHRMAETKHGEIQGLANMMQDLRAVLEWYPEFADAYDLMAVARMEGGGLSAAMQAERAAMQLNPRDDRYVYHLAQIYIADKKWEAAKALLERLKTSGNAQLAAEAREQLDQLASQRKYGIATASGTTPPKLEPQKSPFDVLEQDAAKRAAGAPGTESGGPADKRAPKFIKGRLVRVDCSQAPAAVVTIASEGTVLKLRAPDYRSLLLIGADDFSCDWRDRAVTVNYKPGGTADGDLVSLEVR
jgi:tetratricopeptide (TPR) repeat protein